MNKISRNDPCPCGSGKKYKRCCMDKVLPFPSRDSFGGSPLNPASEFTEMVKRHFENGNYQSLDEMNFELDILSRNFNAQSVAPFLGLSPNQMSSIMYSPFVCDNDIFKVEIKNEDILHNSSMLQQALFFLNKLKSEDGIKATQKGNLSKKFVVEFFEQFFKKEKFVMRPNRESDLPEVTQLRFLLDESGYIKKRSNKFLLTKKGIALLENNNIKELFENLLINYINEWNWGYMDGYPELNLIQQSATFNFLLLKKKCKDWTIDDVLGEAYLDAFPALVREIPPRDYSTPRNQVIRCFSLRFLNRFCLPMGLVELEEKDNFGEDHYRDLQYYKPTELFNQVFNFKI